MMAVLNHLQEASKKDDMKSESLQEAIFAISNAYSLNMHNSATKERYPLNGLSLIDVFMAGRAKLLDHSSPARNEENKSVAPESTNIRDNHDQDEVDNDAGFNKFVQRLKDTTTFFKGIEVGSAEYSRRISRAREKYDSKRLDKKAQTAKVAEKTPEVKSENIAKAESLKIEGNAQLKAKNHQEALDLYSKCIELDPNNAVYYSNRAAANLLLSRFVEAVDDCKQSIACDDKFVRPRERLASAYKYLGMTKNEIEALKGALSLAPDNEAFRAQLSEAEAKLAGNPNGGISSVPRGGEMPGNNMPGNNMTGISQAIERTARAMGVPSGAFDTLVNSGVLDQVVNVVRDNPSAVQQAMQAMMGGGAPPGMGGQGSNAGNSGGNGEG